MIGEEHVLVGALSEGGGFRAIAEISLWSVATTVAWATTITVASTTATSAFLAIAAVSVTSTSLVAATSLVLASMHLFFGTSPSRSSVLPPPDSGVSILMLLTPSDTAAVFLASPDQILSGAAPVKVLSFHGSLMPAHLTSKTNG